MHKIDLKSWSGYDAFNNNKKEFIRNLIMVVCGVLFMGISLGFLLETNLGTDPYTFMNVSISTYLGWTLGNWQLTLNAVMFVIMILITGLKLIGPGTVANMILVGYTVDFTRLIIHKTIPDGFFMGPVARPVTFILGLAAFLISAAVYMNSKMGLSPYDGLGNIICTAFKKFPFAIVRIIYDSLAVVAGVIFGDRPNIGTIAMVIFLGPAITIVGSWMEKHIFNKMEKQK